MSEDEKHSTLRAKLSRSTNFIAPAMIAVFGISAGHAIMSDAFGENSGYFMAAAAGEAEAEGEAEGEAEAEVEAEPEAEAEAD